MEVTKKAEYAISALVELAINPGEYISSKEVATRENIPTNFLPQIIAVLGTQGWVEGVRGPGGGVRLLKDPHKITVREVVELIEGPMAITRCLTKDDGCNHQESCPLHTIWARAQAALLDVLGDTTLADVVEAKLALDEKNKQQ